MTVFCNNLRKGDAVFDTKSRLRGIVARTPRSANRRTSVRLSGKQPAYLDVMDLRFIPPGETKPEDVPPVDGDAPPLDAPKVRAARVALGPSIQLSPSIEFEDPGLHALKDEWKRNAEEIAQIEARFKVLRAKNERLDKAIAVLQGIET